MKNKTKTTDMKFGFLKIKYDEMAILGVATMINHGISGYPTKLGELIWLHQRDFPKSIDWADSAIDWFSGKIQDMQIVIPSPQSSKFTVCFTKTNRSNGQIVVNMGEAIWMDAKQLDALRYGLIWE